MGNGHPTFPNPTIQEALCEIHFQLPYGVAWKPSLFGELFKNIQDEFPDLEPVTEIGIRLHVGGEKLAQAFLPAQQRMRYKHASRKLLLQLSENVLTTNILPKYPGWIQMSQDILNAWKHTRKVIKPAAITRIGLRYINRIERSKPDEFPREWLAPSDYIPKAVLTSLPGFLSRLEMRTDPHKRTIVTLGETPISGDGANAIVLDIDCIVEKEMGIEDKAIIDEITLLHDAAWSIFSASMTPRLEQLLLRGGE